MLELSGKTAPERSNGDPKGKNSSSKNLLVSAFKKSLPNTRTISLIKTDRDTAHEIVHHQ